MKKMCIILTLLFGFMLSAQNEIEGDMLDGYVPVAGSPEEFLINTFKKVNSGQMTLEDFTAIYTKTYLSHASEVPPRAFTAIKNLDLTKRFILRSNDYNEYGVTGCRQIKVKSKGDNAGDFLVKKIDGKYRFTNMRGE